MKLQVSRSMQQLVTSMRVHGNTVERFPGGFWRCEPNGGYSFGTSTVEALVSRGIAEYSEWKDGRSGRFPIKATLKSSAPSIPGDGGPNDAFRWVCSNCKTINDNKIHHTSCPVCGTLRAGDDFGTAPGL